MGILNFAEAAEKLATNERNVRRLVARGRLKGTRLGESSHLLLTDSALEDYVARGAPDYDEPPLSQHGGLYDSSEDNFLKGKIEGWIWEAATAQFLTGETVHSRRMKNGGQFEDIELTASATLRQVLDVALPEPKKVDRKKAESLIRRFQSRREFFFAMELREVFAAKGGGVNGLTEAKFFESPEAYQQSSEELLAALMHRNLVKSVTYTPTVGQAAELREKKVPLPSHPIQIKYLIPFGVLIEGHGQRIIEVAF